MSAHFFALYFSLCFLGQDMLPSEKSVRQEHKETSAKEDKWFGGDKAFHFVGSILMVGMGSWIHGQCHHHGSGQDVRFGMGFSFSLGILKELFDDLKNNGRFSWKDMAVNTLGIFLGALLLTTL